MYRYIDNVVVVRLIEKHKCDIVLDFNHLYSKEIRVLEASSEFLGVHLFSFENRCSFSR